ncbi:hypothetical protein [Janibacter melonis]|uniref:hypothetical protein n=1 Tax=Janibacter melonis TaxID=262209 RepID=UPI002095245A|nr:hypothetical protein [Janibacter melonis]
MLERAVYVERASGPGQVVLPAAEVGEGRVPYMSLVVVPGEGCATTRPVGPRTSPG